MTVRSKCPRCNHLHLTEDDFCENCLAELIINDAQEIQGMWLNHSLCR